MIHAVFGVIVGLLAGACVGFTILERLPAAQHESGLAVCVAAGAITGAIVGGTKDIVEAIRDTRKLKTKL